MADQQLSAHEQRILHETEQSLGQDPQFAALFDGFAREPADRGLPLVRVLYWIGLLAAPLAFALQFAAGVLVTAVLCTLVGTVKAVGMTRRTPRGGPQIRHPKQP
ncbi:DUF3040 domain-containing protein [Streptomyces sp. TRM66268-LWL]|uniref:DUF3040 domain-containing protein n=1 Tax=Streptomyces polyasparticus TaxID=2767826 RepID=A0ABR7SQ00_9ACTN|nr:DUF3040 domain-containing protein [Streptomyces polyasparticus]MBC9717439.1 DUF3040 domain-containing protein [Streptomyces polyasparticus]